MIRIRYTISTRQVVDKMGLDLVIKLNMVCILERSNLKIHITYIYKQENKKKSRNR